MKESVVIQTHNRSRMLEKAVNSVLNQTYKDLEIIIVSNESTDDTDLVINKLKERDHRIYSISYLPARGANYARNKGIENTTGELVAFLDDDDEWYEEKIEKQVKIFSSNESIGLVYTGKEIIYVKENIVYN